MNGFSHISLLGLFKRCLHIRMVMLVLLIGLSFTTKGQVSPELSGDKTTRILFIVDASRSMLTNWEKTSKINAAREILNSIVDTLKTFENVEMGLRVYGHQSSHNANNCRDSRLEVSFRKFNSIYIKRKLQEINPQGITPIAYSLEKGGNDFPADPNSRNIIIVITDGMESCNADPCQVAKELKRNNVILRAFVIGLGVQDGFDEAFGCFGEYYNAQRPADFKNVMEQVVTKILSFTSTRIDLLDNVGRAMETDANMTFYDAASGLIKYNYYHSFNDRGESDTVFLDPVLKYNLMVHTVPPVEKMDIEIVPEKKNVVKLPTPQGYLKLTEKGGTANSGLKCVVSQAGKQKTIAVQQFNTTEKYLVGKYDLEILTLPRTKMKDVEISQSKTTMLEVPVAGIVTIIRNFQLYGSVFHFENDEMVEVYQLSEGMYNETVALQPGKYKLVYRSKSAYGMEFTEEKDFEIRSGGSISIKL